MKGSGLHSSCRVPLFSLCGRSSAVKFGIATAPINDEPSPPLSPSPIKWKWERPADAVAYMKSSGLSPMSGRGLSYCQKLWMEHQAAISSSRTPLMNFTFSMTSPRRR